MTTRSSQHLQVYTNGYLKKNYLLHVPPVLGKCALRYLSVLLTLCLYLYSSLRCFIYSASRSLAYLGCVDMDVMQDLPVSLPFIMYMYLLKVHEGCRRPPSQLTLQAGTNHLYSSS